MMQMNFSKQKGNGMLEMILSLPIAVAVLFVGADLGMSFVDRALVNEAIRESLHHHKVVSLKSGDPVRSAEIAQNIIRNIEGKRIPVGISEVEVEVLPVSITYDSRSGTMLSSEIGELSRQGTLKRPISKGNFKNIYAVLEEELHKRNSVGQLETFDDFHYAPQYNVTLYIVSVKAMSPSLDSGWTQGMLGSALGYQVIEAFSMEQL